MKETVTWPRNLGDPWKANKGNALTSSAAVLAIVIAFGSATYAGTLRVPSDYSTILAGLDASVTGDTVLVAPGTYGGLETRIVDIGLGPAPVPTIGVLRDGVTLRSESGPSSTILDVNGEGGGVGTWYLVGGLFDLPTLVEGFAFAGAEPEVMGILVGYSSKIDIRDCVFDGIDGGVQVGAAITLAAANAEIANCEFLNCHSVEGSAAVLNVSSSLWMKQCHVEACYGADAPVAHFGDAMPGGRVSIIQECTFVDNIGGGIMFDSRVPTQIVENCTFVGNMADGGAAIRMDGATSRVRRCIFSENRDTAFASSGGAIDADSNLDVEGCTFWRNSMVEYPFGGSAISAGGNVRLENNLFAGNRGGEDVSVLWLSSNGGGCNDHWDNPSGAIEGAAPYATDIFVDPRFCDAEAGDWTLEVGSPCLPAGSGACGLIGALGQGCGSVSVMIESWGRIKGRYR